MWMKLFQSLSCVIKENFSPSKTFSSQGELSLVDYGTKATVFDKTCIRGKSPAVVGEEATSNPLMLQGILPKSPMRRAVILKRFIESAFVFTPSDAPVWKEIKGATISASTVDDQAGPREHSQQVVVVERRNVKTKSRLKGLFAATSTRAR